MLLKMNLVFSQHYYHHVSNKNNNNNVHFEIRSSSKKNNGGWRGGGGEVEARDRVIDFGKYKGKMLGSIPSSYLKWVSKNLRAGDSEEWAKLADQVLRDPIYKDRIEWEFVHNLLTGSNSNSSSSSSSSVAEVLEEISCRFGWDNQDKVGWSKLDFELLGTSKAARIPRLSSSNVEDSKSILMKEEDTNSPLKKEEQASSGHGHHNNQGQWGRRMERRHRQKLMRSTATTSSRMTRTETQSQSSQQEEEKEKRIQKNGGAGKALFPGREAFLRKAVAAAQLNSNNNNNNSISYL